MNIYPFSIYAVEMHQWVESPRLAKLVWLRDRREVAPDLAWYGLDLVVNGPTSIEIHVRDMQNSFHGGLGDVRLKYVDPPLTEADLKDLAGLIRERQTEAAAKIYFDRKAAQKAFEIESVRKDIFGD